MLLCVCRFFFFLFSFSFYCLERGKEANGIWADAPTPPPPLSRISPAQIHTMSRTTHHGRTDHASPGRDLAVNDIRRVLVGAGGEAKLTRRQRRGKKAWERSSLVSWPWYASGTVQYRGTAKMLSLSGYSHYIAAWPHHCYIHLQLKYQQGSALSKVFPSTQPLRQIKGIFGAQAWFPPPPFPSVIPQTAQDPHCNISMNCIEENRFIARDWGLSYPRWHRCGGTRENDLRRPKRGKGVGCGWEGGRDAESPWG